MNFYSTLSSAQIPLINTSWEQVTGLPVDYDWSATAVDNSSNLFVVGNTSTMDEGANILLTKYNSSGVQQWQVEWNGTTDGNDYGVSILLGSSAVFVAGATYNETNADYDWVINKYNPSNGSLTWSYIYSDAAGGHDIPADMVLDTAGNLIITGARQGSTTLADMCTVKLNSSGTHQWTSTYDYSGYQDAGAKIVLVSADGVMVTGGSGNSWTAGDIATVRYASNGTQASTNRTTNSAVGFDLPMYMKRDGDNNIYIVGRVATVSSGTDIKLLKLDEDLNVVWTETVDGYGEDDCGNALVLDDSGDLTVTGYMTNANGKKELCLVSFENDGDYKWHLTRPSAYGGHAEGNALLLDGDFVLCTGYYEGEFGKEIITISYDQEGNQRWLKLFGGGAGNTAIGRHIKRSVANTYYVSGTVVTGGVQRYVSIKYAEWEQPFVPAVGEDSTATHVHGEVIISFSPQYMLQDAVNDRGKIYGSLAEFVTQQMIDSMNAALGADVKFNKVVKVFRNFTVADSLSVTRLGDTITIPPIWSTLVFTYNHAWTNTTVIAALNDLWPMIEYAEVNGLGRVDCDEILLPPNDYFIDNSLRQFSLVPSDIFDCNADINIGPAWEIGTGKENIKVGVYDFLVRWDHPDFLLPNGGSKVAGGWDYRFNQSIYLSPTSGKSHGTQCAGIIGSLRNNNIGIAGIAGGDALEDNSGCQLFSMAIASLEAPDDYNNGFGEFGDFVKSSISSNAIIEGAVSLTNGYGYGFHIQNHSWSTNVNFNNLRVAVKLAAQHSCVLTASRGNLFETDTYSETALKFPACYEDEFVMNVGASGNNGSVKVFGNGDNYLETEWRSYIGQQMDFIAPGTTELVFTTVNTGNANDYDVSGSTCVDNSEHYNCFSGTSSAAPHAAGVAAIMLSQHNVGNGYDNNLAPEDVEQMIERYATDIDSTYSPPYPANYDIHNGWGRINAGLTMQMINAPEYRVWHSGNPSSTSVSTASPTGFILAEHAYGLSAGIYTGANVQVTHTYNVSFPENIDILAGWGRRTSVLGYLPLVTNSQVYNTPFATWSISISGNIATVTAVTNCIQISDSFWLPAHPNQLKTPFSLHLRDLNYASTVEKFADTELELVAFPNPVSGVLNLELNKPVNANMQVSLLNGLGQPVYTGSWNSGSRICSVDCSTLPAGLYCLLVKHGNRNLVKTIIVD